MEDNTTNFYKKSREIFHEAKNIFKNSLLFGDFANKKSLEIDDSR